VLIVCLAILYSLFQNIQIQKITWESIAQLPESDSLPKRQPTHGLVPLPGPTSSALVEFLHLTTAGSAAEILASGIQPRIGESSGDDLRFFEFTLAPRYVPSTTQLQLDEMMQSLRWQLKERYGENVRAQAVHILLPEDVVRSLEREKSLVYGPFYPRSAPGYTESIFDTRAFATINSYRATWRVSNYP